jgi:hypothetical protein
MVGLIHHIFLDWVKVRRGVEAVSEVKRRAGVPEEKVFRLSEVYDDEEFQRLLGAGGEVLGLSQSRFEDEFAAACFEDILERWPTFFRMSRDARELLERQPAIHNSFASGALSPTARRDITDKFRLERLENETVAHYSSVNRLCGFYMAIARRVVDYYENEATIEELQCMRKGDPECEIHIQWL